MIDTTVAAIIISIASLPLALWEYAKFVEYDERRKAQERKWHR